MFPIVLPPLPRSFVRAFLALLALVALGTAPPLLEPQSIVEAANAVARLLFY